MFGLFDKLKRTKTRVTVGYGGGVTGPTTPSCTGVTVQESILHDRWISSKYKEPYPSCLDHFEVVSSQGRTIAIFPCQYEHGGIEEAKANAQIFADALNKFNGKEA